MLNKEVVERIDTLLKERNLKRQSVYDYANIASNSFPNWTKREDSKIPAQVLYQIAEFLNVSIEYLLTGKNKTGITPEDSELIRKYNSLQPHNKNAVLTLLNALYEQENN